MYIIIKDVPAFFKKKIHNKLQEI